MDFEWDENKRQANIEKHGVDFVDAIPVFFDPIAIDEEDMRELGERRYRNIGMSRDGDILFVAYTWRGTAIRIISARRANRNERRKYHAHHS